MKNHTLYFITLFSALLSSISADSPELFNSKRQPSLMSSEPPSELIVYNRILAKIHGKTISVIDVLKKMDLFLQRNYPHLIHSKPARFQFYASQWHETLTQIINQELILADAEHLELKVSDAEVREEMLNRFGPAIMATLDSIDLTYEEAKKMIYNEIVVQRMMWYRVNSKALNKVNPKDIKCAYKEFCIQNPSLEQWKYQVLSLRSVNQALSEMLAAKACDLIHHAAHDELSTIADQIKKDASEDSALTVTLSSDLEADEKSIALPHKEVLQTLTVGNFSKPIPQVSRADNSVVYRIFHLKEHTVKKTPSFEKTAEQLREGLLNTAASAEHESYIAKLRTKMGYDEHQFLEPLPDNFQPFVLR